MNIIKRNIPNSITCVNVASGVMSIFTASYGTEQLWGLPAWQWACVFIGVAAVADFLDGFMARLLGAYSDLGKELDSLCDLVSFGVAPAAILFHTLPHSPLHSWVPWIVALLPVAGAIRLARFNIDTRQTTSFIGLPIPANAIFWIGYVAMMLAGADILAKWWFVTSAVLLLAWLMNSPIPLFSLKFKSYGLKGNMRRYLLILGAVALVASFGLPGLMWLIIFYLLLSAIPIE